MTTDDQIEDKALQYDIKRQTAKISPVSSGETNKYQCPPGEKILPSNPKKEKKTITEQAKFTYSPSGKVFEKHIKSILDQGKKQVDALK